jgi:hypothetical protein
MIAELGDWLWDGRLGIDSRQRTVSSLQHYVQTNPTIHKTGVSGILTRREAYISPPPNTNVKNASSLASIPRTPPWCAT